MSQSATKRAAGDAGISPLEKARAARQANKIDPKETGEQKFRRIANKRLRAAVKGVLLVGNLARVQGGPDAPKDDRGKVPTYKPTDEQINAILNDLKRAVNTVESQLKGTKKEVSVTQF